MLVNHREMENSMSSLSESGMSDFYRYLTDRLDNGLDNCTPEESVKEFRLYQEKLQRLIHETQQEIDNHEEGDSKPLDIEAIKERVRARLQAEGITE